MSKKLERAAPFAVLAAVIFILLFNNIASSSLAILDTDPSTYIIVPMLMLIVLPFFMLKKDIKPDTDIKSIGLGILGFAAFLILTLYMRFRFPIMFLSFRTDLLLFPIAIASVVSILFGIKNIKRFRFLILYSLFASPILLYPFFNSNATFAGMNTQIVYTVIKAFASNAKYIAPTQIGINGSVIGIGTTCAGIGALIGLIMFLLPLGYFYDGKAINKVMWIISGFLIFLVLNLLRMTTIALLWAYNGITSAIAFIHTFIGIFLFYVAIIAMVLLASRFGLLFPEAKRKASSGRFSKKSKDTFSVCAIIALLLALTYYLTTLSYQGIPVSPLAFQNTTHFDIRSMQSIGILARIEHNASSFGFSSSAIPSEGLNVYEILLANRTFTKKDPITWVITKSDNYTASLLNSNKLLGERLFLDGNNNKITMYDLSSNGEEFFVAYFNSAENEGNVSVVYLYNYIIVPRTGDAVSCGSNSVIDIMYNIFAGINEEHGSHITSAYCIADKFAGVI